LAVVRQQWGQNIPTLTQAADELNVNRNLPRRLYSRLWQPFIEDFIEVRKNPGPSKSPTITTDQKRLRILESLLATARGIIVAAGIARLCPQRRGELVTAIEHLHSKELVSYSMIASELGLSERHLRRLRVQHRNGESLSPKPKAPHHPTGSLPSELAVSIANFAALHPGISLSELWSQFTKKNKALCSKHDHPNLAYTTFCRHAKSPKSNTTPNTEQPHKPERGRDAPKNIPYRALALMDTTDIQAFGFRFKLIPFMEAHSRDIFAHQLTTTENAQHVITVLKQAHQNDGSTVGLRIDRGTPYIAKLTTDKADQLGTDVRVARVQTPTDKAILERFFRTAKDALRPIFDCINLKHGPGDQDWRQNLALTIASTIIAGYLRWGYPNVPQPHIDGLSPAQRRTQATVTDQDTIQTYLDQNVQHHLRRDDIARQIHQAYEFNWPIRKWLDAIKDHIASSLRMEQDDFEYAPFSQMGGVGKAYQLFGDRLLNILDELNERLAA